MSASLFASITYGASAPAKEVVSVCKYHAGTAFNVIAENAQFEGIMRGSSKQALEEIAQIIEETSRGIGNAFKVEVTCHFYYGANAVINDDTLVEAPHVRMGITRDLLHTLNKAD